jgi:hypothetical protein
LPATAGEEGRRAPLSGAVAPLPATAGEEGRRAPLSGAVAPLPATAGEKGRRAPPEEGRRSLEPCEPTLLTPEHRSHATAGEPATAAHATVQRKRARRCACAVVREEHVSEVRVILRDSHVPYWLCLSCCTHPDNMQTHCI